MKKINILFHPEAEKEYLSLPDYLADEVDKLISKLRSNPGKWIPLKGNLSSCRKIHLANAKYRLIYMLEWNQFKIESISILRVLAIWKRKNSKVYNSLSKRI